MMWFLPFLEKGLMRLICDYSEVLRISSDVANVELKWLISCFHTGGEEEGALFSDFLRLQFPD